MEVNPAVLCVQDIVGLGQSAVKWREVSIVMIANNDGSYEDIYTDAAMWVTAEVESVEERKWRKSPIKLFPNLKILR